MVLSADVTRYAISLGTRDSWTGWRAINFADPETIQCHILSKGESVVVCGVGVYAREDAAYLTADPVLQGDHLGHPNGRRYNAVSVREHWDLNNFVMREIQAHELPLYQTSPSATTWTKTRGSDARYRFKVYLEDNVRDGQITKDDDSTQASWAAIFADPPYLMALEFRGTSNMHGFYAIQNPTSTSVKDPLTLATDYYDENVPIKILTIDSTGVTGTALNDKMLRELRWVMEHYPQGSVVGHGGEQARTISLGSMDLYETTVTANYRRLTTT